MGYKCNQSSSTLKNEVTTNQKREFHTLNSSHQHECDGGAKKDKCLLEWYLKATTTLSQHDEKREQSTTDYYEISSEQRQEMAEEAEEKGMTSLAYRNYQQRISSQHSIRTTTTAREEGSQSDTLATSSSSNNVSHSHLVRQSICFYAASSVILALCYLTTPTSASTDAASHPV